MLTYKNYRQLDFHLDIMKKVLMFTGNCITLSHADDLPDWHTDEGLQEADAPDQRDHHDQQAGQDNHQRYPGPRASVKFCVRIECFLLL